VAAANALSDIYAMGGKPLTALNIVAFPISKLDQSVLADILRGAADKVAEAGATLVGGHSIDDPEPKFGMAVTGLNHPERVLTNAGACPGDKLILTKPIGVGIMTTSLKRGLLRPEEIDAVTRTMTTLNKNAAEAMAGSRVHACTDVTGFGLMGHSLEMAKGSGVGLHIYAEQVPVLPRVRELAGSAAVPGGTKNNFRHVQDSVRFDERLDEIAQWILCDAVTSGGLLLSVAAEDAQSLVAAMRERCVTAACIGEVVAEHANEIRVTGAEIGAAR
jgi:selenide,water dikinase